MSLNTQTLKRLPTIKEGLLQGTTRQQIAQQLGVNEKTIDRDITRWVQSGTFEDWLKEEFLRLHVDMVHVNPELAYVQVSKLIGHMLTRKIEKKQLTMEKIEISWKTENDASAADKVQSS
jgi:IS30 family transposase